MALGNRISRTIVKVVLSTSPIFGPTQGSPIKTDRKTSETGIAATPTVMETTNETKMRAVRRG